MKKLFTLLTAILVLSVFGSLYAAQVNYPGGVPKQGAVKNSDGSVTFCVAAPNKSTVSIVGAWNSYRESAQVMNYQDYNGFRYFWYTVSGLDNSTYYPYYFCVDNTYRVADPYGKLMLDRYNDQYIPASHFPNMPSFPSVASSRGVSAMSVYKGDIDEYDWKVTNFTPASLGSIVIYETLIRDFTGDEGQANGNGTFKKALEKIDYLSDLGITAIELMPVMEFDGNSSWGYGTSSYMSVDKQYGTANDLRDLIDACHERGIAVICDVVFNHTTDMMPWYAMYASGTSPFFNATAPHNHSVYNDINQGYGLWEPYFIDVLTYWMTEFKVDGFRFDLVKGMGDNSSYNNNYDGNNANSSIVNRMKRIHAAMKKVNPNVIHINEFFGNYSDDCALGNDGQLVWIHQKDAAQRFAKGWDGYNSMSQLNSLRLSRPQNSTVDYVESHDEQWLANCAISDENANSNLKGSHAERMKRMGQIGAILLAQPGPKMVWEMGELGYDEHLEEVGIDRLNKKPVHWNYLNDADRMGVHDTYKAMMNVRKNNPDLFSVAAQDWFYDGWTGEWNATPRIRVLNADAGKELIVFINASPNAAQSISQYSELINNGNYKVITSSKGFTPNLSYNSGNKNWTVNVPANGYVVIANSTVATEPVAPPAPADWYLVGNKVANGSACWVDNDDYKFTRNADGTYSITVASLSGEIKAKEVGTWKTALSTNGSKLQNNVLYNATRNGENIVVDGTITNATITIDTNAGTIIARGTKETTPEPDPVVTYVVHGSWTSSTWVSKDMTKKADGTWTVDVEVTYGMAAFGVRSMIDGANGTWYRAPAATTVNADCTINLVAESVTGSQNINIAKGSYTMTLNPTTMALSIVRTDSGEPEPEPETPSYVIYFDNSNNCYSTTPHVYLWGGNPDKPAGSWPGTAMTVVVGKLYKYEFECTTPPTKVQFNGGNNSNQKEFDFENGATYKSTGKVAIDKSNYYVALSYEGTDWDFYKNNKLVIEKKADANGLVTFDKIDYLKHFRLRVYDGNLGTTTFVNGGDILKAGEYISPELLATENTSHSVNIIDPLAQIDAVIVYDCVNYKVKVEFGGENSYHLFLNFSTNGHNLGWSKYYAHVWDDTHNVDVELIPSNGVYELNAIMPFMPTHILFFDGTWGGAHQTENVSFAGLITYFITGSKNSENKWLLTTQNGTTGVDDIDAADEAPVYYNLQGVRVDNPSAGMYIVVRGSKVTKEVVR